MYVKYSHFFTCNISRAIHYEWCRCDDDIDGVVVDTGVDDNNDSSDESSRDKEQFININCGNIIKMTCKLIII